ncbi:unnamed protein product [Rhodiola kirilowii]
MSLKEGQSTNRPLLLEGPNYGYWKSKMNAFLKSLDEKAWSAVLIGWTPPLTANAEGIMVLKPEELWTDADEKIAAGNSKAMNAIFSGVDENVFKLISNCEIAKEAWDTLRIAYEGTDKVRNSRMEMVKTKFEELKMKEEETIAEFNARVLDLSNEAAALGKPIKEKKMDSKVRRSLPQKFAVKVTTIEEVHDISTLKLEELMGSLRTYEMDQLQEPQPREGNGIALKAELSGDKSESGCSNEQLAMMAQNFSRMVRKINRYGPEQGQSSSNNFQNYKKGKSKVGDDRQEYLSDKSKEIQCQECRGYGHIQAECANTLKKKTALAANLSDNESDVEEEDETTNFVAFVATIENGSATNGSLFSSALSEQAAEDESSNDDDEELTQEALAETYKELYKNGYWCSI